MFPTKRLIHVFLDNARYHHTVLVQEWLARPGCRIKLHFIPGYCPHLNPIERPWRLMHQHVTHNRCYASYNDFCRSALKFLREEVPKNWAILCDSVTDQFPRHQPRRFSGSQSIGVYNEGRQRLPVFEWPWPSIWTAGSDCPNLG